MKKFNPLKVILGLLAVLTFMSTAGAITGTLAWYAYVTRATLSYSGTSVNSTIQLQVGICSNHQVADMPAGVTEKQYEGDSSYYYFAKPGSGLNSSIITAYLDSTDYATNSLQAVTSGSYVKGGALSLKKSPNEVVHDHSVPATHGQYVFLPLVFRVLQSDTPAEDDYVAGSELWLTGAAARASGGEAVDGNIYKALRAFIDRDTTVYGANSAFIFNPSATGGASSTTVGGILDLSGDNYFDFERVGNHDEEVIFGEYTSVGGVSANGYDGEDVFYDINGTGITDRRTTFTAKHYPSVNYYSNYNSCVFKTAAYETLTSIAPVRDPADGLSNADPDHPTSICTTADASDHYLGRVNITVYLEGWDHSVIDDEIDHRFDLGLTFEINRVDI